MTKEKTIRAVYDEETITVYQAYNKSIALSAVAKQTFVSPPFKMERMTWIKPSFLWTMYRSGWATKEDQEYILAIKIKREGFEWALRNACLSKYDHTIYPSSAAWSKQLKISPARVQWDPERDIDLHALPHRAIQVGITGIAVEKYVNEWITQIDDITTRVQHIRELVKTGKREEALSLLPDEQPYLLPDLKLG